MSVVGLDPLLQAPARLQIMAVLAHVDQVSFARLRTVTHTSDSVTSKHLSALAEAKYLTLSKTVADGRQQTWASLTDSGRKAFANHVTALKQIVDGVDAQVAV